MKKIIRTSTVPESLSLLLKGQLSFLNQYFEVIGVSGEGDFLNEVERREKVKVVPIKMERKIAPLSDFISLVRLYLVFKKHKPIIVHSITPKAGLLSMVAAKMAGVPIRIHTFTGLIFPYRSGLMQSLLIKMDRILCWSATNIYPEGNGVKNDLQKFKITRKPLKVLANGNVNGVDLNYFDKSKVAIDSRNHLKIQLGIHENDFVFIFVGRLVKEKGITELINAFEQISSKNSNTIKLLLVGNHERELDPLSEETISKMNRNLNIIEVGFQEDVRLYYSIANCLVFPSHREGFPNVVLQVGAMELPSIVSDISGCNEIIQNNVNGLIVPAKQENVLEQEMLKIYQDKSLFAKLQANAREIIVQKFNQEIVWQAILHEYQSLIKMKNV